MAFLALGLAASWGFVMALVTIGDPSPGFEGTRGWVDATRGLGVALFGVFAVVAFAAGWFFAGGALRRTARRLLGRLG